MRLSRDIETSPDEETQRDRETFKQQASADLRLQVSVHLCENPVAYHYNDKKSDSYASHRTS
jgi:hypothetical protein